MRIRKLKKNESSQYLNRISELHIHAFPRFFLTQLGKNFLKTLYAGYIEDSDSGIIIAENDNSLLGFIAYSNDYSKFYQGLLKRHILKFALCSACAAIRHPSFIKRLLGAFKKSDEVAKADNYVELASIGIDPKFEGKGIGTKMIDYLKLNTDFNKYVFINLETDADNNERANTFYQKNGFELARSFVTAEGRRMNEYRYYPIKAER